MHEDVVTGSNPGPCLEGGTGLRELKELWAFICFWCFRLRFALASWRPRYWRRRWRRFVYRRRFGREITIDEYWRLLESGQEDISWTGMNLVTHAGTTGIAGSSGYLWSSWCCVPRGSAFLF